MRVLISTLVLLATLASSLAAEEARWLRYPAISPDGESICFSYKGDLWLVPSAGGDARRITTHAATDRMPVWSPDGSWIAFASDRHGNFDVFVMRSKGGPARRLTYHSATDLPSDFTPDGSGVIVTSRRTDDPNAAVVTRWMPELYVVPLDGGRLRQVFTTAAYNARMNGDSSRVVYEDLRGFENTWRKHHTSSVARDIRVFDPASGTHTRVTTFVGEDRDPVWAPDGKSILFLSERSGSLNVWRKDPTGAPRALTDHKTHPVRFLSICDRGALCYAYGGDLYVLEPDAEPRRLTVDVQADDQKNAVLRKVYRDGATEMAISPEADEVAFIVRGEVFVTSVEHGTTKRITRTPEQERSLSWAPDGRAIFYASERGGSWNIYKTSLTRDDERRFANATVLLEAPVLVSGEETFQPLVAPDGKRLAYLRERDEIRVLDLESGESKSLVPAAKNYSYADGDVKYRWSADSRWLALTWLPHQRWLDDIGLANVETGELRNISDSGYNASRPSFGADGKTILFLSGRFGQKNHGSWGGEQDVMAFYLTKAAFDRSRLSTEDYELLLEREKRDKAKKDKAKKKQDGDTPKNDEESEGDGPDAEPAVEPIQIEFDDVEHRTRRLTLLSADIAGAEISKDGESVVFTARVDDAWGLWMCRTRDHATRKLADLGSAEPGELQLTKDGKALFVLDGKGRIRRFELGGALSKKGGTAKSKSIPFAADLTVDRPAERAHLFEHVWRQAGRKFYEPELHGADWPGLRKYYASFIPHIANNHDFAELLSEMLGELNASHTGAYHRNRDKSQSDETAALGLIFVVAPDSAPLTVAEVLKRGPCDKADSKIAPGVMITHIDGIAVPDGRSARLLNRRAGRPTRLTLELADGTQVEEVVKPIPLRAEGDLLYERWVESRRAFVEKASKGRLGYVHIRGMGDGSFRRLYREAFGRHSDAEALVVDTRFNGGGWLHDDLVRFFDARDYIWFVPRNKERGQFGAEPAARWSRPTCVVVSEGNYSDAHMFPFAYQTLGLGKVVGAPIPGTGTAVWWETLIDPTLRFGIPQVGMMTEDGRFLENTQLEPDVLVLNEPQDMAAGRDPQLQAAVDVLLDALR